MSHISSLLVISRLCYHCLVWSQRRMAGCSFWGDFSVCSLWILLSWCSSSYRWASRCLLLCLLLLCAYWGTWSWYVLSLLDFDVDDLVELWFEETVSGQFSSGTTLPDCSYVTCTIHRLLSLIYATHHCCFGLFLLAHSAIVLLKYAKRGS